MTYHYHPLLHNIHIYVFIGIQLPFLFIYMTHIFFFLFFFFHYRTKWSDDQSYQQFQLECFLCWHFSLFCCRCHFFFFFNAAASRQSFESLVMNAWKADTMKYNEHHHHSHVLSVELHPSKSMGWIGCDCIVRGWSGVEDG